MFEGVSRSLRPLPEIPRLHGLFHCWRGHLSLSGCHRCFCPLELFPYRPRAVGSHTVVVDGGFAGTSHEVQEIMHRRGSTVTMDKAAPWTLPHSSSPPLQLNFPPRRGHATGVRKDFNSGACEYSYGGKRSATEQDANHPHVESSLKVVAVWAQTATSN